MNSDRMENLLNLSILLKGINLGSAEHVKIFTAKKLFSVKNVRFLDPWKCFKI
jgi:hypothetical protein